MKLNAVELRRVALPLVTPFRTSFGTTTRRDVLLVRVETPDGEGWGECVALTEPVYSSEYADGAEHVIEHHLLPRLWAAAGLTAERVAPALSSVLGHPMAKAALEAAVLDAELRARGESLASHLGATRDRAQVGVSVGIASSIGELLDLVESYLQMGYPRVKLKIEPGWDVEPVRAVRERFGDDLLLQVDANTAYTLADARHLAKLDDFDLLLIEQPLPEDDVLGHAKLAEVVRTPICLDESITSARAAADAISLGACEIVNIKPGRVGGFLEGVRIHDVCAAHGVPVWCGGMLETGIGRAGALALAALPNFTLPADLSATDRYWQRDIVPNFELEDGHLTVPSGPGIGVEVDRAFLDQITTSTRTLTP